MTEAIGIDLIFNAFFFVAVLLAVSSVPHIIFTTVRGEMVVRRHIAARTLDPDSELTVSQRKYLAMRRDSILFHKAVGEELERLGGMRNTVPLAIVSAIILAVMMLCPGYSSDALPFVCVMLAVLILCCICGFIVTGSAVKRYLALLEECTHENRHPENMYGRGDGFIAIPLSDGHDYGDSPYQRR